LGEGRKRGQRGRVTTKEGIKLDRRKILRKLRKEK